MGDTLLIFSLQLNVTLGTLPISIYLDRLHTFTTNLDIIIN